MIIRPIIPIWLMGIICAIFLVLKRRGVFNYIRQILIVALLFVINLRIMIPGGQVTTINPDIDILFVCDDTISMMAEDYNGNNPRMDGVKADCEYIIDQFPGASYGVVVFDRSVELKVPYTVDSAITKQTIGFLDGEASYYAKGSSLNLIMDHMQEYLDRGRDTYQIVFFISDGEITKEDEKLKSYPNLAEFVDDGAVLGYGTSQGGPMKAVTFSFSEDPAEYIYYYDDNFDKQQAISKIDEDNLKSIANDLGVDYIHATKQSDLHKKISDIKDGISGEVKADSEDARSGYSETYYFFVIPLVVLLIIDLIYYRRKL